MLDRVKFFTIENNFASIASALYVLEEKIKDYVNDQDDAEILSCSVTMADYSIIAAVVIRQRRELI